VDRTRIPKRTLQRKKTSRLTQKKMALPDIGRLARNRKGRTEKKEGGG
jgi:hypothetical protein